jgi:protein gp37
MRGERRRVFCASLADWLEDRPEWDASRLRLLATVRATWHLDWLLLTKRPENWQKLILRAARQAGDASDTGDAGLSEWLMGWLYGDKPHNIWTGASVEDQARCDGRIPRLRAIPAVVHFLSAEPLLESVKLDLYGIDWVIVGGESGSNARPVHPDWVSEIRDQCQTAKVPFYFKQWGEWKPICEMSEEENRSLYKSNVKAEDKYDQDKLDDIYGRTCRVENSAIGYGGTLGYEKAFYLVNGHGGMQIFKVGKEKAGRTLNGVEYNEAPNLCS